MTCTRCQQPITRGQKYYRTKKGSHHGECPAKRIGTVVPDGPLSMKMLARAAKDTARWLEWDLGMLEDFQQYGSRFGIPGENVYELILQDALRYRGMTLEGLRGWGHK